MESKEAKFVFVVDNDDDGEFCVIPLGGKAAGRFFAKIDVDDYEDIARFNWFGWYPKNKPDKPLYAKRKLLKAEGGDGNRFELMHRRIMVASVGQKLDHKNGDGLDSRRQNLRFASSAQNNQNRRKRPNLSSRYKGVYWGRNFSRWVARIDLKGKRIGLGYYKKKVIGGIDVGEIEAAKAYDDSAIKYFGSFARLNFPAERNIVKLKDGIYKMSYIMSQQDKKNIIKKIKDLQEYGKIEINEILGNRSIPELQGMCHFFGCGINELVDKINRYNHRSPYAISEAMKGNIGT